MKPSSRYSSYDARSSTFSSAEFKLNRLASSSSSRAVVVKSKPSSDPNLTTMVKKFIEHRSSSKSKPSSTAAALAIIPPDAIAAVDGLKKPAAVRNGSSFAALHRKLFGKAAAGGGGGSADGKKKEVKTLTEVKANTRTLAMVLRSERELLSLNKDQQSQIAELKLMLEDQNTEVDKLKDLCLKQREEIKSLKSAILFPDVVNSQLQELLEKQGLELKQAKQVIPNLQRQVTCLTGQLQCLAVDLTAVKADKQSMRACFDSNDNMPTTPTLHQKEQSNSLEFSSGDPTSPVSPDEMFLKDLNPCLTPFCAKSKSKDFDDMGYYSPHGHEESLLSTNSMEPGFNSCVSKFTRSSDGGQKSKTESTTASANRRCGGAKHIYANQTHRRFF